VGHEPLCPVKSDALEVLKRGTGRYKLKLLWKAATLMPARFAMPSTLNGFAQSVWMSFNTLAKGGQAACGSRSGRPFDPPVVVV
jgi:hypothetical protein